MYLSLPIPTSNNRKLEILFFPLIGRPVRYKFFSNNRFTFIYSFCRYAVRVHKFGCIQHVREALATIIKIAPEQVCYLTFQRNFMSHEDISDFYGRYL